MSKFAATTSTSYLSASSLLFTDNYQIMTVQTNDAAKLFVVNPSLLGDLNAAIFASSDWDVLNPSAERQEIDALVFDALGMTIGERDAVNEGVFEMVGKQAGQVLSA